MINVFITNLGKYNEGYLVGEWFQLPATEEEIKQWCVGKIASYKKPRSVVFADDFPKSPVGKILRAKVVEQFGKP